MTSANKTKSRKPKKVIPKSRILAAEIEKAMLAIPQHPVQFSSKSEGILMMSIQIQSLSHELYRAIQSRRVWEEAIVLTPDELFFVGGQLGALIRRAEIILNAAKKDNLAWDSSYTLCRSRVEEVKEFRKYIIRRIQKGF
jgi:hypothetical protein